MDSGEARIDMVTCIGMYEWVVGWIDMDTYISHAWFSPIGNAVFTEGSVYDIVLLTVIFSKEWLMNASTRPRKWNRCSGVCVCCAGGHECLKHPEPWNEIRSAPMILTQLHPLTPLSGHQQVPSPLSFRIHICKSRIIGCSGGSKAVMLRKCPAQCLAPGNWWLSPCPLIFSSRKKKKKKSASEMQKPQTEDMRPE